jgi:hypothetical protein
MLNDDYISHICAYFNIEPKVIKNLPQHVQENLEFYLGPLSRPLSTVKEFLSTTDQEHDLVVTLLGLGQVQSNNQHTGQRYIRILGADQTGQVEVSISYQEEFTIGQQLHISGIRQTIPPDGFPRIRVGRTGSISVLPFLLLSHTPSNEMYTPASIDKNALPTDYVIIKGIVISKGILESFQPKNHSQTIYSLKLLLIAKETIVDVYLNKDLAKEINTCVQENHILIIENIKLKVNQQKVIAYSSIYSRFHHNELKNFVLPSAITYLYFPLEETTLASLKHNSKKVGTITCFITPFIKRRTKRGEVYKTALTDGEKSGFLQLTVEEKHQIGKIIDKPGVYKLEGIFHSHYNHFRVDLSRFDLKKSEDIFSLKTLELDSNQPNNILSCFTGKLIKIFLPEEFKKTTDEKTTIHRVKFVSSGIKITMSAVEQEHKDKLANLELNKTYNIFFVTLGSYYNSFTLKFTDFTLFQELGD